MTESILKTDIFNWLLAVIPTLYVGDLSVRPAGTIAFVWHMSDISRPATPLLEGRLSNDARIGRDYSKQNSNGSQAYSGDREEWLYFTSIGPGAVDTLKSIRNSIEDTTARPTFAGNSFIIIETQPIVDAHQYLDSMPEDRATLDLRIRFLDAWSTAAGKPGIIETANQTGKVN